MSVLKSAKESQMNATLLNVQDDPSQETGQQPSSYYINRLTSSTLRLGLVLGVLLAMSESGASYIIGFIWGEVALTSWITDLYVITFLWVVFASFFAVIVGLIRSLLEASYESGRINFKESHFSFDFSESLDDLTFRLECRLVVGVVIGLCTTWIIVDVAAGRQSQIVWSTGTLLAAVFWLQVMLLFFGKNKKQISEQAQKEKTQLLVTAVPV